MNFRLKGLRKCAVLYVSVAGDTRLEFRTEDWGVKKLRRL